MYNIAAAADHDGDIVVVVAVQCYIDHGTSFDFANVGDASAVMMVRTVHHNIIIIMLCSLLLPILLIMLPLS